MDRETTSLLTHSRYLPLILFAIIFLCPTCAPVRARVQGKTHKYASPYSIIVYWATFATNFHSSISSWCFISAVFRSHSLLRILSFINYINKLIDPKCWKISTFAIDLSVTYYSEKKMFWAFYEIRFYNSCTNRNWIICCNRGFFFVYLF